MERAVPELTDTELIEAIKFLEAKAATDLIRMLEEQELAIAALHGQAGKRLWAEIYSHCRFVGVTEAQIYHELGASLSTQHRWATRQTMPDIHTRGMMVRGLIRLLRTRVD